MPTTFERAYGYGAVIRRRPGGLTVPEILVGSFISLLMASALFAVVSQLKTQAHTTDAVMKARYDMQFLFRSLGDAFDKTTAEGVHVTADSQKVSLQRVDGMASNGTRAWSPFVTFYVFDASVGQVLQGRVELAELGLTHQPALPAVITDGDLDLMINIRRSDGKLKPVANDIEGFAVDKPSPLTARLHLTAVVKSGKYKDERVEDERTFFFSSGAEL